MKKEELFINWLNNHPCSTEELWKIQNCLGTVFGFNSAIAMQAAHSWERSRVFGSRLD